MNYTFLADAVVGETCIGSSAVQGRHDLSGLPHVLLFTAGAIRPVGIWQDVQETRNRTTSSSGPPRMH